MNGLILWKVTESVTTGWATRIVLVYRVDVLRVISADHRKHKADSVHNLKDLPHENKSIGIFR